MTHFPQLLQCSSIFCTKKQTFILLVVVCRKKTETKVRVRQYKSFHLIPDCQGKLPHTSAALFAPGHKTRLVIKFITQLCSSSLEIQSREKKEQTHLHFVVGGWGDTSGTLGTLITPPLQFSICRPARQLERMFDEENLFKKKQLIMNVIPCHPVLDINAMISLT